METEQSKRARTACGTPTHLLDLPPDVLAHVASHLAPPEVARLAQCCRCLRSLVHGPAGDGPRDGGPRGASGMPTAWRAILGRCLAPHRAAAARLATVAARSDGSGGDDDVGRGESRLVSALLPEDQRGQFEDWLKDTLRSVQRGAGQKLQAEEAVDGGASMVAAAAAGLLVMPRNCQRLGYVTATLACTPEVGPVSRNGAYLHIGKCLVLARVQADARVVREFVVSVKLG
eukprot:m51a1_g4250 hypothetical protein (231) ;mRNA; f:204765-206134